MRRWAVPLAAAFALAGSGAARADALLVLQLVVNGVGVSGGQWVQRSASSEFWLPAPDLARWRLKTHALPMQRIDGVAWHQVCAAYRCDFDDAAQRLSLHGDAADFDAVVAAEPSAAGPLRPPLADATGGHVNYDVWLTRAAEGSSVGALLDANWSGAHGLLHSGWLLQHDAAHGARSVSLGSWWQRDWPEHARTLIVGHAVAAPAPGRAGFAYAGVRLGTDTALDPSLAVGALPSVNGAVSAPAALDLVVDGRLRRHAELAYGPFDLAVAGVESGRHDVELRLVDASGAVRIERQAWYYSPRLLAPGRVEWALEAGRPADGFDLRSAAHGAGFGSASARAGVTRRVTVQALAHASRPLSLVGGGVVANALQWAVLDVAAYAERERRDGARATTARRWSAGAEHQSRRLSAQLRVDRANTPRRSRAENLPAGQLPVRAGALAQASLPVNTALWRGALGVQRLVGEHLDGRRTRSSALQAAWRVRSVAATLLARRASDELRGRAAEVALLLSTPLGARWDGALALQRGRGTAAGESVTWSAQSRPDFERPAVEQAPEVRLGGALGDARRLELDVATHHAAGDALLSARSTPGQTLWQALWRGAVGVADGAPFATRPIRDGFLVVGTPGHADVPVAVDHRPVGRTDATGRLVVPDVRTLDPVEVAIDATALPLDTVIARDRVQTVLPRRAGAVLRFDAERPHGAVQVRHADGRWPSAGSRVSFPSSGWPDTVIGRDGVLYVSAPADGQLVWVDDRVRGGRCVFALPRADAADAGGRLHDCVAR